MRTPSLALLAGALVAGAAYAEEHFVVVYEDSYDPAVVRAAPGDTIRWGLFQFSGYSMITSGEPCTPDGLFQLELTPPPFGSPAVWSVPVELDPMAISYFDQDRCASGMSAVIRIIDVREVPGEYPTIQEAIDAAEEFDMVLIDPGTYHETGLTFGVDNILVRGALDAEGLPTVIIGPEPGTTSSPSIMSIDDVDGIEIEGIQFTGSRATTGGGLNILNGSTVVKDCLFTDNLAVTGGGLSFSGTELSLVDCTFRDNAANLGAGASFSDGTVSVTNCVFEDNDAEADLGGTGSGGGFWTSASEVFLTDSLVRDNCASAGGGGITASSGHLVISSSVISENEAVVGGGIYLFQSTAAIGDSRVCANSPDQIVGSWTNAGNSLVREECGVLFVPDDFSTIQGAVDAANDGDVIVVAPGTYSGEEGEPTVRVRGKTLTISGAANAEGTPLVMLNGSGNTSALSVDDASDGPDSSLVLENLHLVDGWMDIRSGSHVLTNCIVENAPSGALFMNCQATLNDCIFRGNYSPQFAGVIIFANPDETQVTMVDCLIEENLAGNPGAPGGIAGIYVPLGTLTMDGCIVRNNASNALGLSGIWNEGIIPVELLDTTVCGNTEDDVPSDQIQGSWIDQGGNSVAPVCASDCPGDLNGDGIVDGADLSTLLGSWGESGGPADIDHSGLVDGADLAALLGYWGPC